MDEAERPIKDTDILEQIESEMHYQDERFWKALRGMQRPTPLGIQIQPLKLRDRPSPPQLPVRLSGIISRYGLALIEVEASKYTRPHPSGRRWMVALARRVENRVMNLIEQLESRDPLLSLNHHGITRDDMLRVLRADSAWAIDMYSFESFPQDETPSSQSVTPDISQPELLAQPSNLEPSPSAMVGIASITHQRLSGIVTSPSAARKLEEYLRVNGIGMTDFAGKAQTTDRTLRNFRKTGKVRRDIFENIARAMDTTKATLLES